MVPLPPHVQRICSGWSCAAQCRGRARHCTGGRRWFAGHGQVADAIRHIQEAGDWTDAARLLADHSFSLTLDGQERTVAALVRAFPPGCGPPPS